jgi:hypothetical protein
VRFLPPSVRLPPLREAAALHQRFIKTAKKPRVAKKEVLPANVIHLAGSLNTEYCYDAVFGGRPNGAFTKTLIDAYTLLEQALGSPPTFEELLTAIREKLPSGDYPQTPVLNASAANKQLKLPF